MGMPCSYDIRQTWENNCENGPKFASAPPVVPVTPLKSFLGLPVRSRIGIAAGLLLNRRWILPYAARGFDILTYKTVRSTPRPGYPLPNWVFVEDPTPPDGPVFVTDHPPADPTHLSSSVCFGMPSIAPELWREDVRRTRAGLGSGQVLIVSVVATPGESASVDDLAEDFGRCAGWAAEAGAQVIEANLSCPNVCSAEGTLYQDAATSQQVVKRIREAIGRTPLLLKIGRFPAPEPMRDFLRAIAALADGVTLVNCISRPVLRHDGQPAFGPQFRTAGVLGRTIHQPSVDAVQLARDCLRSDRLNLQIVAVGGVSTVGDFADFFAAGADAVLCGSSPMYLPNLAIDAKLAHPEW